MDGEQLRFDGQVAIVSGAGRGLGRSIALKLAESGAAVVVNDFGCSLTGSDGGNSVPASEVAAHITAQGGKALAVVADIGTAEGVRKTLEAALSLGGVHVLVHNASPVMGMTSFLDATEEGFHASLNANLVGSWQLARQCWPILMKQGYGRVVFVHSAAGLWGRAGMPAYSMAKSGLSGFAKYLAGEGAEYDIRVNCVAPVAATRAWEGQHVPENLREIMSPDYVAETVCLFSHKQCPVSGELFHSVGQHLSRVVIGQTQGITQASAAGLLKNFDEVMKLNPMDWPKEANESGALIAERLFRYAARAH